MIDPEYIKMVLALPDEFFKGWEWKAGDYALLIRNNKEIRFIRSNGILNQALFTGLDDVTKVYMVGFDQIIPIPSQERLQKMLIDKMGWSQRSLLIHVNKWFDYIIINSLPVESFEIELLKFYQYFINDCEWDGEKWILQEIEKVF